MHGKRPDYENLSWSLWSERTSLQIDGLTYTYAWLFIANIPRSDWSLWKVWHDGLTRWSTLDEFEQTSEFVSEMLKRATIDAQIPGLEERELAAREREILTYELESSAENFKIDQRGFHDHRKHRRYSQRFSVLIDLGSLPFQTHTLDISMGGMRIALPLPENAPSSFPARLEKADGSTLVVACRLMRVPNSPLNRIRFVLESDAEAVLRSWLLNTPEVSDGDEADDAFVDDDTIEDTIDDASEGSAD